MGKYLGRGHLLCFIPFSYITGPWSWSKGVTVSGRVIFCKPLLEKKEKWKRWSSACAIQKGTRHTAIIHSDSYYASSVCILQVLRTWNYSFYKFLFHWIRNFTIVIKVYKSTTFDTCHARTMWWARFSYLNATCIFKTTYKGIKAQQDWHEKVSSVDFQSRWSLQDLQRLMESKRREEDEKLIFW